MLLQAAIYTQLVLDLSCIMVATSVRKCFNVAQYVFYVDHTPYVYVHVRVHIHVQCVESLVVLFAIVENILYYRAIHFVVSKVWNWNSSSAKLYCITNFFIFS